MRLHWLLPSLTLLACDSKTTSPIEGADARDNSLVDDDDGDGYGKVEDCDDADAETYPHADELCDGRDNNCNGEIDEDAVDRRVWFPDLDGDTHGDPGGGTLACEAPAQHVSSGTDCDDTNADAHPRAEERCDGIDNDCDGTVDESTAVDATVWYRDEDGDGHGDPGAPVASCGEELGLVDNADDCDDNDEFRSPTLTEVCNGVDDNCDGVVDEAAAEDAQLWFLDADGDGYGHVLNQTTACVAPEGWVADGTDCDDTQAAVNPAAVEVCGGRDEDCDGAVDEADAEDATVWYADLDGDTHGDMDSATMACVQPADHTAAAGDCDDTDEDVHPGATETCNGVDDDCDGATDGADAVDRTDWFADTDGDGFGDPATSVLTCASPTGYIADNTDCDDTDVAAFPGAIEYCNGVDDNCDGTVDESTAADATTWYTDADGDGYGNPDSPVEACVVPADASADFTDCDDTASFANPGATEICGDGVDGDCDGTLNECGLSGSLGAIDSLAQLYGADGDGLGVDMAAVGDVNGDGFDDILVGANTANGTTGAARLFLGPLSGTLDASTDADATLLGASAGDQAGWRVAGLGDVDGDGYDDVAVSAWAWEGGTATRNQGAVFLVHGPLSGTTQLTSGDARLQGAVLTDFFGYDMTTAGDLDGDGTTDVVVGAFQADGGGTNAGAVMMFAGSVGGTVLTTSAPFTMDGTAGDNLGFSVAAGFDLNGDGMPDLAAGARSASPASRSGAGAAYVVLGPISGSITTADADATAQGMTASDQAGWSMAGVGDHDGDGYDDLLVGAVGMDDGGANAGMAYLVRGPATGAFDLDTASTILVGEGADDQAGRSVGGADLNGDGLGDLLIGAYSEDTAATNAGAAYVVHGPSSGVVDLSTADVIIRGDSNSQLMGSRVTGAGDLTGDGVDELMVSGPGADTSTTTDAGLVWIFAGEGL